MPDPTEEIVVLRSHLEEVLEVLNNVRGYLSAEDLAAGFRDVKPAVRPSRLTAMSGKALERVAGYLEEEE
jgi:hypothetical protein